MGPFAYDTTLCLREFSKSSTNRAYSWYPNLKPSSVHDFEHHVSMFIAQIFCTEPKLSLADLDRVFQCLGEDLDKYVKRIHNKALDCYFLVEERMLLEFVYTVYWWNTVTVQVANPRG